MKLVVKSDRDVVVDGLGVLSKDEERTFSEEEVEMFMHLRGLPPTPDNMPEGVTVAIDMRED